MLGHAAAVLLTSVAMTADPNGDPPTRNPGMEAGYGTPCTASVVVPLM